VASFTRITYVVAYSATALLLAGCNKTLDFRNAEISNNKIYESGGNEGFSGKITNLPFNKMPVSKIEKLTRLIGNVAKEKTLANALGMNALTAISGNDFGKIVCDASVTDGVLDGEANCKVLQSPEPLFKLNFSRNVMEGKVVVYDLKRNGNVVAEANFRNGELDGESKIYSYGTSKLIHHVGWEGGVANGAEEQFDESTGKVIFSGTLKSGAYDGVATRYSPDGRVLEKTTWALGKAEVASQSSSPKVTSNDACVDLWSNKHRQQFGQEVVIGSEQIDEWTNWCKEGKMP
jgi:antitoxin component YwqK of YwqJK toxin-antitoxin module